MDNYNNSYQNSFSPEIPLTLSQYVLHTFSWMFLGLLVTFGTAYGGYASMLIPRVLESSPSFIVLVSIVELVVVIVFSARIHKLSIGAARALFLTYSVLNGIVFSSYFLIYEMQSLIIIFGLTALYFGLFALFGYVTKRDLSGLRPILTWGLIFLCVVGLISIFLPVGRVEKLICLGGIAIFLGFTAYDTQKIRAIYQNCAGDTAILQKGSIIAALQLYLDFINLFLYLLRFMGRRKD